MRLKISGSGAKEQNGTEQDKSTFKVVVSKKGRHKGVSFSIDHQTFQLHIEDDPDQSQMKRWQWYAKQLRIALKRLADGTK